MEIDQNSISKELSEIHTLIFEIKETKQDRIKPIAYLSFIIWAIGLSFSIAVWTTTTTVQLESLQTIINNATKDRYTGSQAISEMKIRDQALLNLSKHVENISRTDEIVRNRLREVEAKIIEHSSYIYNHKDSLERESLKKN